MIIEQIQREAEAMLRKYDFFTNVEIIVDEDGEMDAAVEKAAGGRGLWVVIELAKGRVKSKDLGPRSINFDVLFTVTEIPALNRDEKNESAARKRATDVVEQIMCVFSAAARVPLPCIAEDFELLGNMKGRISWQVRATAEGGWKRTAA